MANDKGGRKILWWNLPISPDDTADVGRDMFRNLLVWVGVIVVLVAIIAVIVIVA